MEQISEKKMNGTADTLVEVQGLKKYFDTKYGQLHAVDDVNLSIKRGGTLGVVGESGCGKSTLGRIVLHLLEPTDGKIFFEGNDITHVGKEQLHELRRQMSMIFQDPYSSINPRMTAYEIICEPLKIYNMYNTSAQYSEQVLKLMDTVGLAQRNIYSYPHELDGGRRQRIGIARALAVNPEFIVCDEPVSALDVSIQAQILNLMQDLQAERKLTYMFITHNMSVVKHISDTICVLYLGQVVEICNSKQLFKTPYHPYTKALLSAIPIAKIGAARDRIVLKGELSSPINPKPGCRFAPRCQYATAKCSEEMPELAEVEPNHMVACHRVREI